MSLTVLYVPLDNSVPALVPSRSLHVLLVITAHLGQVVQSHALWVLIATRKALAPPKSVFLVLLANTAIPRVPLAILVTVMLDIIALEARIHLPLHLQATRRPRFHYLSVDDALQVGFVRLDRPSLSLAPLVLSAALLVVNQQMIASPVFQACIVREAVLHTLLVHAMLGSTALPVRLRRHKN